jgi:AcrR family transcriptional regulator
LSEVEEQIFAATERLLEVGGSSDCGVAQICREAGIARGTFYFYFSSKTAVIAGLLARVMDEIYDVMAPFAAMHSDGNPAQALATSLRAGWKVWSEHRKLMRATCELWADVPELRELWLMVMERFTEAIAAEIDRERELGIAGPGIDSRRLAAMLLWSTERLGYVAGLGLDKQLPSEEAIFESVLAFWLQAIYGRVPPELGPRYAG